MSTQINVKDALLDAEAALDLAIQRILKRDPGHAVHVTSEAKALVSVRQALSQCQGCDVQQGYVPAEKLSAEIQEPQKFTGDSEMRRAFEIEYGQSWTDPDWHKEAGIWASAWHKATAAAQQSVQTMPAGWVPCVITYEGAHPEEIAYGPQIMMDRLKKWLDRYFEMRAHPTTQGLEQDAARYRWLRSRDVNAISQGGVFIGVTPDNYVINEEHADQYIDTAIAAQAKQGGAANG